MLPGPYAFPITSCLTDSLQGLCKPDTVGHTDWLGVPKHAGPLGTVGCSPAQSEAVLTDTLFLCEVNLVLLVEWKLPLAGNTDTCSFFSTGSLFPQSFVRTKWLTCQLGSTEPPLKHSCPCTERSVRILSESIQLLGHRWAPIVLPCTPLYCLPVPQSHSLGKAMFTFH